MEFDAVKYVDIYVELSLLEFQIKTNHHITLKL